MQPKKVVIIGAAGRDFHNFNMFFRDNPLYRVEAFTAAQIPDIAGRRYPAELAGKLYPHGILIYEEEKLPQLIKKFGIDVAVLSYSDLNYVTVMRKSAVVNAAGADFWLLGPKSTMLKSKKPVVAVCAVRTGCGKSQTTRYVIDYLKKKGKKVVAVRHPMPYGDLKKQIWQRYETPEDLNKYNCTIEEREEYEPLIRKGVVVYAGVDYAEILRRAEKEADIVLWDGGNNDFPFFKPDVMITVADPLRPGHEQMYYPGEVCARMADVVVINKENSAARKNIEAVRRSIKIINPKAAIVDADSEITVDEPGKIRGKKVIVIEDGPTVTHGGMAYGAGAVAARRYGCRVIDARKYAAGSLKKVYEKYPHIRKVLPSMGYYPEQLRELERTVEKSRCEAVIIGTPADLGSVLRIKKPMARVKYELKEIGKAKLQVFLTKVL
ncbi:MAG: cyclic 2,3-diphosphoglycerate synthase [Candidatus Micrarchaeota archaeon]